jgi:predicted PurR-regulated permease PerM
MVGINSRVARYTWTVVAIFLIIGVLYEIRDTLFAFIVALFFAYLLWPLLQYFDKHLPGRSRVPALAVTYIFVVGLLSLVAFEIGSRVVAEANNLAHKLPDFLSKVNATEQVSLPLPMHSVKQMLLFEIQRQIVMHSKDLLATLPNVAAKAAAASPILFFIFLVPIISFFYLKDRNLIAEFLLSIASQGSHGNEFQNIGADVHLLLSHYMRALAVLAGIAFTFYALLFSIIRVPYAILLATLDFPLEFIPIAGPFAGAVIVTLVAAFSGYRHLWWLVVFMALFRLIQDYAISPHIMSSEFKLPPLVIIFGVLAGAEIAGIIGCFVSVPMLVLLRIVYLRLQRKRVILLRGSAVPPAQ